MRTIVLTKRLTVAIVAISACVALVSAAVLANYIVSNTITVTSKPTLTVFESDGVTRVTTIAWGDVQEGQSGTHQVLLTNTGGASTAPQYIVDSGTCRTDTGACDTVSSINPTGLPSGVTISWNFDQLQTSGGSIFTCTIGTTIYNHCISLTPGTSTPAITVTVNVAPTAPTVTAASFTIEFDSYQTPSG